MAIRCTRASGVRLTGILLAAVSGIAAVIMAGPAGSAATKSPRLLDERVRGWTDDARARINEMILVKGIAGAQYDSRNRPVAAFDWDNTIFKNDMGDATIYWMLRHDKVIQPARKDWSTTNTNLTAAAQAALNAACDPLAAAGKPLATSTGTTSTTKMSATSSTTNTFGTACADEIFAIYDGGKTTGGATAFRNAETLIQKQAYAWLAQLQAGYTPEEIRGFARAAYEQNAKAAVGSTQTIGSKNGVTAWGRIYDQMRDLLGALQESGFDVWIVTASPQYVIEPIARHAGVEASHVIGIRTVLRDGKTTSTLQGCGGIAEGPGAPITYDAGKRCWLNKIVFHMPDGPAQLEPNPDLAKRQVFAAGDSDTDIAFMKDATFLKVSVNRNQTQLMCNAYANSGNRWVVQPMFLLPKPVNTGGYSCSTALDHGGRVVVPENGTPIADQRSLVFTLGQ